MAVILFIKGRGFRQLFGLAYVRGYGAGKYKMCLPEIEMAGKIKQPSG